LPDAITGASVASTRQGAVSEGASAASAAVGRGDRSGGKLVIESTANQDCPLMDGKKLSSRRRLEHAYYLKYQKPPARLHRAWWNVVNWAEVNKRLR